MSAPRSHVSTLPTNPTPTPRPKTFLDLPDELLAIIISYLHPAEAVKSLPAVDRRLDDILDDKIGWKHVDLNKNTHKLTAAHVVRACSVARFDARYLRLPDSSKVSLSEAAMTTIMNLGWKCLERMRIPPFVVPPSFETLVEVTFNSVEVATEQDYWRKVVSLVALPSLKRVSLGSSCFFWPKEVDFGQMSALFDKLDAFHLCSLPSTCGEGKDVYEMMKWRNMEMIILDAGLDWIWIGESIRLKELKLVAPFAESVSMASADHLGPEQPVYPSVEKLSICLHNMKSTFLIRYSIFQQFMNMKELSLDKGVPYLWNSVPERIYPQLEKLEVSVTPCEPPTWNGIPRMTNLTWLYLNFLSDSFSKDLTDQAAFYVLRNLKSLKQLKGFELSGVELTLQKCAEAFFFWECSLEWLSFKFTPEDEVFGNNTVFAKLIKTFRHLKHFSFRIRSNFNFAADFVDALRWGDDLEYVAIGVPDEVSRLNAFFQPGFLRKKMKHALRKSLKDNIRILRRDWNCEEVGSYVTMWPASFSRPELRHIVKGPNTFFYPDEV